MENQMEDLLGNEIGVSKKGLGWVLPPPVTVG